MAEKRRLIVVSNRLPVTLAREGNTWQVKRSAGGLATAMDPILRRAGGVWIGWSGAGETPSEEAMELLRQEQACISVDLPADIAEKFYEGYSNQALWPLFHSFTSKLKFDPESWDAYVEANRRFCDVVVEQYHPGDQIWIHDYHLMLLPAMLRDKLPNAAVGFFLHIPFPASDIFSLLPRGEELIAGLLGADLIAFHTHVNMQHFRRSLRRLLGVESKVDRVQAPGREVLIQALPIGIAPDDFLGVLHDPDTEEHLLRLRTQYQGRKLMVAVDRLDYTKGLPERLRTFRRLLSTQPELIGKVVLLQVAVPSRENIESYQDLTSEVNQLISEINGEFGTSDWVPIVYIHRNISRPELVALYHFADLAWVSPLRDGMNLVAKEYVACKPDGNGVLLLSAFAGAAAEMGEAILINPYDEERTAEAITRALAMSPEEQRSRMGALHERVLRNNVFTWGDRFLGALDEAVKIRGNQQIGIPSLLPVDELLNAFGSTTQRLLLVDYDGTLVPFVSRPQDAIPDSGLRDTLTALASNPANAVLVLSGRRAADLETWFGNIPNLGLAAEHGATYRLPGSANWQGRSADPGWKETVRPILEHFVDRTPGSCVEEKDFALVWHYRMAEAEFAEWLAGELVTMLEGMLADTELRAFPGNKIVEVKPSWANKGEFAQRFLEAYPEAGFIFAVGDDRTDEDLFGQLPANAWSVHVGDGVSNARYRMPHIQSVRQLLRKFSE